MHPVSRQEKRPMGNPTVTPPVTKSAVKPPVVIRNPARPVVKPVVKPPPVRPVVVGARTSVRTSVVKPIPNTIPTLTPTFTPSGSNDKVFDKKKWEHAQTLGWTIVKRTYRNLSNYTVTPPTPPSTEEFLKITYESQVFDDGGVLKRLTVPSTY